MKWNPGAQIVSRITLRYIRATYSIRATYFNKEGLVLVTFVWCNHPSPFAKGD